MDFESPRKPETETRDTGRADCIKTVDLRHLETEEFCPVCHNLSLADHGPRPSSWEKRQNGYEYYGASYKYVEKRTRSLNFTIRGAFEDQTVLRLGSASSHPLRIDTCRYCAILRDCLEITVSHAEENETREVSKTTLWVIRVLLYVGRNARLKVVTEGRDEVESRKHWYEIYTTGSIMIADLTRAVLLTWLGASKYPLTNQGDETRDVPSVCNEESLRFIRDCLKSCQQEHSSTCFDSKIDHLPTRLLSIDTEKDEVSLVSTESFDTKTEYLALSHCWGKRQPITTTRHTEKQHREGIGITSLPILFQNAVEVSLQCGVVYLWIDSLCIIQDDKEDWASESARMALIYENALFVVAAVRSASSDEPILGTGVLNDVSHIKYLVQIADGGSDAVCELRLRHLVDDDMHKERDGGPLTKRAWPYQELMLARKIVRFTDREVIWHCQHGTKCQCRAREGLSVVQDAEVLSWDEIVRQFSRRHLTVFTDRLPAVSGLAAKRATRNRTYLAGLWLRESRELGKELAWLTNHPLPILGTAFAPNSSSHTTPSWSWASLNRGVTRLSGDASAVTGVVELLEKSVRPVHATNPYGQVDRDSFLLVRSKVIEVDIKVSSARGRRSVYVTGQHKTVLEHDCTLLPVIDPAGSGQYTLVRARSFAEAQSFLETPWPQSSVTVKCMLSWVSPVAAVGIVISTDPLRPSAYQRLGTLAWLKRDHRWTDGFSTQFEGGKMQDITLV